MTAGCGLSEDRLMNLVLALLCFTIPALASASVLEKADRICNGPERHTYSSDEKGELQYLCALPERVKRNVPEVYWMEPTEYQKWLSGQSEKPTASCNFGKNEKEGDQTVNRMVLEPNGCHFYSSISPSVQKNKISREDPRTKIVWDFDDLMSQCRTIATAIESGQPRCHVIEFAGHATQSVGLDTIFGVQSGKRLEYSPSENALQRLGRCLRRIADKKAYVVFSVCGGDRVATRPEGSGVSHYWPGKSVAQQRLTAIFELPILSGIGFVDGTPEGGVTAEGGWHLTEFPRTAVRR